MESPVYIQNALRTESIPATIDIHQIGLAVIMQLAIQAGELVDLAKRKIFYGKDIDLEQLSNLGRRMSGGTGLLAACADKGINLNALIPQQELGEKDAAEFNLANINIRLLHAAFGAFTESGELIEAMYKQYTTGQLDLVNFGEEIGDIEWYQAIGFDETGVTEASCREKNIAKLRTRYPQKFDAEQAIARDLAAERKTLE